MKLDWTNRSAPRCWHGPALVSSQREARLARPNKLTPGRDRQWQHHVGGEVALNTAMDAAARREILDMASKRAKKEPEPRIPNLLLAK